MNRTEAKARAAELGISQDEARRFGNLSKTQSWLDAISAHETIHVTTPALASEVAETSESLFPEPLCPDPWDANPVQLEAATLQKAALHYAAADEPEAVAVPRDVGPEAKRTVAPDSAALVYPLLLFGLALWVAYQLVVGVGALLTVGLTHMAQKTEVAALYLHPVTQLRSMTSPQVLSPFSLP